MESLFSFIPEDALSKRLYTLSQCVDLPVQLLNEMGKPLQQHMPSGNYCAMLRKHVFQGNLCDEVHLSAGKIAYALGESYIFSCQADLNHIAFPLVHRKLLIGTIIIGPFLMDTPDSTLISKLSEKYSLSTALSLELYDELQYMPVVPPKRVSQISHLTGYIFGPLLSEGYSTMKEHREKLYQQSRINESIQLYKGESLADSSSFTYQKEQELLSKVKIRDITSAKAVLNDLLGFVLFSGGEEDALMTSRSLELTTLLSRVAIEGGAPVARSLELNHAFITRIQSSASFEDLCYVLQDVVESFVESISIPEQSHGNLLIKKALHVISTRFNEPLTLRVLAEELSLSPSYFSSLFAKQMKVGFQEYLTSIRIEEAKRLLVSTNYPISQIAVSVGYADQSSFTKAFKRMNGITPFQMR